MQGAGPRICAAGATVGARFGSFCSSARGPVSLPRPRTRDPQRHCVIDLVLHRHPYRIGDLLVSYSDHDLGADRRRPAIDRVLGLRQVRWRSNGNCCVPIRCTGASARCSIWNAVLSWRADFWPQLWRSHVTRWSIGPIFHSEILTTRRTFESCAPRASSPSSESSWASHRSLYLIDQDPEQGDIAAKS